MQPPRRCEFQNRRSAPGRRRRRAALAAAVGLMPLLAGCRSQSPARQRLGLRAAGLRATLRRAAGREADNPRKLADARRCLNERLAERVQALRGALSGVGGYLRRDLQRWRESRDDRLRQAGRLLRGKPQTIRRAAILFM